ncbi:multiprotein-bridging factor 1 family protein [Gluconobacter roseus]|uniref:helix-turn-helix domain-containing protein n=1 Tax=Gluconobacter roseus TaxID=586239 RepID=UPI0038D18802
MSFRIVLNKFEMAQAGLFEELQAALSETFEQEAFRKGLTQEKMAADLDVDPSTISKWMRLQGNPTLKTVAKLYAAMNREPWSNLKTPEPDNFVVIDAESNVIQNHTNNLMFICQAADQSNIANIVPRKNNAESDRV